MSKLKAILKIIVATNYLVITDKSSQGSISPLYADHFLLSLRREIDGLILVQHRHKNMLNRLANKELGELFNIPEVETAPEWDGHTPQDVAKRLREYLAPSNKEQDNG